MERARWSIILSINKINSPNFEEVAFKTPVGSMSDIVQSANGFHLIYVVETK